jgi:hypothetical protein
MALKQKPNSKETEYWLNEPFTSNRYTALLEEKSQDQQHKTSSNVYNWSQKQLETYAAIRRNSKTAIRN